jgi:hypothetical protein
LDEQIQVILILLVALPRLDDPDYDVDAEGCQGFQRRLLALSKS